MVRSTKRATVADVMSEWSGFVDGLEREVIASRGRLQAGEKLAPYDSPDGVLKRGAYGFVRSKLKAGQGRLLDDVLDNVRTAALGKRRKSAKKAEPAKQIRIRQKAFSENPFHYALRELPSKIKQFRGDDLNRYGRQMLYAYRHEIEPDLLIGFLAQTGTMKEVAAKAVAEPQELEEWFRAKQEAAKLAADRKTRYPLAVIHFTATSTELDSCPIEVGFAKARGRNAPISSTYIAIETSQKWNDSEKWPQEQESQNLIVAKDLINRESACEVIEKLSELTVRTSIVHCQNIENVSHWLDMLISAAERTTDFQLRDVGDFIDHNANKRAELRRQLTPIPVGVGSAGLRAQQLCEVLRSIAKH